MAYCTEMLPCERRLEGIGHTGCHILGRVPLSTVVAECGVSFPAFERCQSALRCSLMNFSDCKIHASATRGRDSLCVMAALGDVRALGQRRGFWGIWRPRQ